jgi:predicted alpha/beta hydrolase family esterase
LALDSVNRERHPSLCAHFAVTTESLTKIIDALNSSFLDHPFNWSAIRANAGELSYFMGDDDQYVPQEQLLTIARELEVQPIVIPGAGHLNSETGYTRFPELLAELQRIAI